MSQAITSLTDAASEVITVSAGACTVLGKTATERRLSALKGAPIAARMALMGEGGKVGKAAAAGVVNAGLGQIVTLAAQGRYQAAAAWLSGVFGESCYISNRASFQSLPDQMQAKIDAAKRKKNGGMVIDKKTELQKPGTELARALRMHATVIDLLQLVDERWKELNAARLENTSKDSQSVDA